MADAKGAGTGATNGDPSTAMTDTLKHLSTQVSAGHLWAASQQGQSSPDAPMLISLDAACILAIPAATGSTVKLRASSTAMTSRYVRMDGSLSSPSGGVNSRQRASTAQPVRDSPDGPSVFRLVASVPSLSSRYRARQPGLGNAAAALYTIWTTGTDGERRFAVVALHRWRCIDCADFAARHLLQPRPLSHEIGLQRCTKLPRSRPTCRI